MLLTDEGEPEDYAEACQTADASKWELAMKDEMKSLISNQTWELVELPMGKGNFTTNGCIGSRRTMMDLRDTRPD